MGKSICRLIAIPPNFNRREALTILLEMEGSNTDGVGSAHIENGEFKVKKWPTSLTNILKKGKDFLEHLDVEGGFKGWTIAHLRAASIGEIKKENTHPFIIDNKWAFCHNGTYSSHNILRLGMSKQVTKWEGETDSETLGHLMSIGGAREFAETMNAVSAGVFLGLRKDGALYAVKTSGSLDMCEKADKSIFLASDIKFATYPTAKVVSGNGWFYFDKHGALIANKEIKSPTYSSRSSSASSTYLATREYHRGMSFIGD